MFSRFLYIGAGDHLDPLRHFPGCQGMVFVDMCSRAGLFRDDRDDHSLKALKALKALKDPRVSYHFDTHLPDDFGNISSHTPFDTLIVSGHYPHDCVIDVLTEPFHFVGYSRTYFPKDLVDLREQDGDDATMMARMMNWKASGELSNRVASFTYVRFSTGERTTFATYDEFLAHKKADWPEEMARLEAEIEKK
jgi:hypothetical protein